MDLKSILEEDEPLFDIGIDIANNERTSTSILEDVPLDIVDNERKNEKRRKNSSRSSEHEKRKTSSTSNKRRNHKRIRRSQTSNSNGKKEKGHQGKVFKKLQFHCFLCENSGLLKDDSNSQYCYFELADLQILPPYSFKDLTSLLKCSRISIQVEKSIEIVGDKKIKFSAKNQSVKIVGEVPASLSHLQLQRGVVKRGAEDAQDMKEKIEACNIFESILSDFHKISPESILNDHHWLSNATVDPDYTVVTSAFESTGVGLNQDGASLQKSPSCRQSNNHHTEKDLESMDPRSNKNCTMPQQLQSGDSINESIPKLGQDCTLPLESQSCDLTTWQFYCFLDGVSGLLKCPSNSACLCYFEIKDFAILPPYSYREMVKLITAPHIQIKGRAQKLHGRNNIKYFAEHQSLFLIGHRDTDVPKITSVNNEGKLVKLEEGALKLKEQRVESVDKNFKSIHRIFPKHIFAGSNLLSFCHIDENYNVAPGAVVVRTAQQEPQPTLEDLTTLLDQNDDQGMRLGRVQQEKNTDDNRCIIESTDFYELKNLQLDCFLSFSAGILKNPLDPAVTCYFEIRDVVLKPPLPFIDMVKMMTSPGMSFRVSAARLLQGTLVFKYMSQYQTIFLEGEPPQQFRSFHTQKSHLPSLEGETRMAKMRDALKRCRRLDRRLLTAKEEQMKPEAMIAGSYPKFMDAMVETNYSVCRGRVFNEAESVVQHIHGVAGESFDRFFLHDWQFDCLLDGTTVPNKTFGIIKCAFNATRLCLFELEDISIIPPYDLKELVKMLTAPHIRLKVNARKLDGNNIEFVSEDQGVILLGQRQEDALFCFKYLRSGLRGKKRKGVNEQKKKLATSMDLAFNTFRKISIKDILNGSHRYSVTSVDVHYRAFQAPPV